MLRVTWFYIIYYYTAQPTERTRWRHYAYTIPSRVGSSQPVHRSTNINNNNKKNNTRTGSCCLSHRLKDLLPSRWEPFSKRRGDDTHRFPTDRLRWTR